MVLCIYDSHNINISIFNLYTMISLFNSTGADRYIKKLLFGIAFCFSFMVTENIAAQTYNVPVGSYLVNMGITPQTVGNGLKPYGMIYDLLKNNGVTVVWSINPSKVKDGIDFSHNGINYRGSSFIIPAEYRTAAVNAKIASWQAQGVVGATSVSTFTVPVYATYDLRTVPRWTLDQQNGSIATGYFVNAGIPASAHGGSSSSGWKLPSSLNCCDDLFVMPHADPIWSTHSNLFTWNLSCKGAIWAACHATSALENMVNPANRSQQTNFLTVKDPAFTGTSGNYANSNSLILWGAHSAGTPAYSYRMDTTPVAQFMGPVDASTTNGSEQIIMPRQGATIAKWNPNARVIAYDPTQANVPSPDLTSFTNVASVMVYGRGFDDLARGYVMYQPAHTHNKATAPDNIAAQRAFFNYSFLVANEKAITPDITGVPGSIPTGSNISLSHQILNGPPGSGPYTSNWASTCGGSFSPNPSTASGSNFPYTSTTTFTPPVVTVTTPCNINITVTDNCGRQTNISKTVIINACNLTFNNTITNVTCNGLSNGSISLGVTGSAGPYTWNWSRVSPAATGGPVTSNTITNLSAGTYTVTVTAPGSCSGTFTALITQPNVLTVNRTITNYLCFGQTGAINLTVTGGTPAYTYDWSNDGPDTPDNDTKDLSGITAGTYTVTVTDSRGCTASTSATITGPMSGMSLTSTKTNVSCNGGNNGSIDLGVSGGTPGYTYSWSNLPGSPDPQDQSGLSAGTYTVTVTDVNGCTATRSETITQPAVLSISLLKTDPTCPPGATPPVNSNGSIDLSVTGGTPVYTYSWSNLAGSPDPQDQTGLTAGTYTVTVTDANSCTATGMITLNALNALPNPPSGINNN
jgi:hypothetical protein